MMSVDECDPPGVKLPDLSWYNPNIATLLP